jgi:hypothetical protein
MPDPSATSSSVTQITATSRGQPDLVANREPDSPECVGGSFSDLRLGRVRRDTPTCPRCNASAGRPVQAYVRWEEQLPPGYRLREDADLLVLLGPDEGPSANFAPRGFSEL